MTIRDELLTIQGNEELLLPESVVDWARSHPDSALYRSLQWDDEKAAQEYRVWQVRRLIAIHIVHEEEGYREAISLSVDRTNGGGYRRMADVLPRVDLREQMLADAVRDLERLQAKYKQLTELASVWAAKDAVKTRRGRRRPAVSEVAAEARP